MSFILRAHKLCQLYMYHTPNYIQVTLVNIGPVTYTHIYTGEQDSYSLTCTGNRRHCAVHLGETNLNCVHD